MRTSLRHMLSALRFSRLTVFFLVLQTVLACAFLSNALFFIAHQAAPMLAPTGIAKGQVLFADHIYLPVKADPKTHKITGGTTRADLATLEDRVRAIPGVEAVSVGVGLPYTSGFSGEFEFRNPKTGVSVKASTYLGDHLVDAMGLHLVAGRRFVRDDIGTIKLGGPHSFRPNMVIVSQALADRLFAGGHALGHRVEMVDKPVEARPIVVGIVRNLPARQPVDAAHANAAVLLPMVPTVYPMAAVVVRTRSGARARVAHQLPKLIAQSLHMPNTISPPRVRTFEAVRNAYFRPNRSMIWLMLGVTLAVVAITAIGIMGLTGFWVQRRTRSIGIRRALGATHGDILRYFLVENFLVVGAGVVLGVLAAWGGNLWLMAHLALPHLPLWYLAVGAAALWILGQLAVLAPALRASHVPPVVATRSV